MLNSFVLTIAFSLTSSLVLTQNTVTMTATTITQTFTAAESTAPVSPQYADSLTFREAILNSTNTFRYEHSAGYIYWNETLASYAQAYSERCVWQHSHGPYGENLARGYPNVTSAVDAWGNERDLYHFSSSNPTGFSEATGHFTQLVWQSTQATGCGWTDCNGKNGLDGIYVVCEYWPEGNIEGDDNSYFEQNVLSERKSGDDGFSELDATRGVTGGTPTSTSGPSANTPAATNSGESIGAPMAEVDSKGLLVTVCVTFAAVLFGLGMS